MDTTQLISKVKFWIKWLDVQLADRSIKKNNQKHGYSKAIKYSFKDFICFMICCFRCSRRKNNIENSANLSNTQHLSKPRKCKSKFMLNIHPSSNHQ